MNDDNSNESLLKAFDKIQAENHKRLELLSQKIKFFEEYIRGDAVFKKTEVLSSERKKEVIISVESILTDVADLFLVRRDKNFLSACLKIIQDKFSVLNRSNALNLVKTKRIYEIKHSLNKKIADLEEKLKYIQDEIAKKADFWNEIDVAEKAMLYLPEYRYIKNLIKEVEVTSLDDNLIKEQVEQFTGLKDQYGNIIQPVDEFEITWTD